MTISRYRPVATAEAITKLRVLMRPGEWEWLLDVSRPWGGPAVYVGHMLNKRNRKLHYIQMERFVEE
jgi:hypothetical protein